MNCRFRLFFGFLFLLIQIGASAQDTHVFSDDQIEVIFPNIIVETVEQEIVIHITDAELARRLEGQELTVGLNEEELILPIENSSIIIFYDFPEEEEVTISIGKVISSKAVHPIPLWLSILPPLIAIMVALIIREVYSALFCGVWLGAGIIAYFQGFGFFGAILKGFLLVIDTYIVDALVNSDHISIILFSMVIAATVALITKNGGMKGVMNRLSKYATSPRSGSFITWLLGIMIFFDDYANTLVVGNTMRPLADRLKISREKLAYIIDSTAAPVASIAFVTTWIGAELSYIQDGINTLNIDESAYGVFFNSLAYSFYPFFTLAFILILIWKGVDYGPMLKAEARARQSLQPTGIVEEEVDAELQDEVKVAKGIKPKSFNAVIPVLIIVFGTLVSLFYTGWDAQVWNDETMGFFDKLSTTIGNADSFKALLWSSLLSLFSAVVLTISQKLLDLKDTMESVIAGFKTMLPAVMILVLAWSVALITEHLHTANFISNLLLEASVSPYLIPSLTFIIAALVSFSTGSSWGTMAILYPLVLPTGWILAQHQGLEYEATLSIFHNIAAAVLTGSVFGDHCSPISDTTILSSLASSCPHIEHVRTQLPYALTTGTFAIFFGILPASYNIPVWWLFPLGVIGMFFIIHFFGKKSEHYKISG
jgi:Na+/H+ antiporter NhaC